MYHNGRKISSKNKNEKYYLDGVLGNYIKDVQDDTLKVVEKRTKNSIVLKCLSNHSAADIHMYNRQDSMR